MRIKEHSIHTNAFNTRYGYYEFLMIPFGMINAPVAFMDILNGVFSSFLDEFVLVFINYILVFSRSKKEHKAHLRLAL